MTGPVGVVYLVHFAEAFKHARHYTGFCEQQKNLDQRMKYHRQGRGSKLLAAVSAAGIEFKVVRLWVGTRSDERALKNGAHSKRYCPVCNARPYKRVALVEII